MDDVREPAAVDAPVDISQLKLTNSPTIAQQFDPRTVNPNKPGQFFGGLGGVANEDLSNQSIVDPAVALKDPNVAPDEKLAIAQQLEQARQQMAAKQEQELQAQAAQEKINFDKFNAKQLEVAKYNEMAKQNKLPLIPEPNPGVYGLTPAKMAALSQPEVQNALQPMAEAINQQTQAQKEQNDFDKQILQQQRQMAAQTIAADKEMNEARARLDKVYADLDAKDKEIDQIDPQRFWKNASTGQKIWAVIAMAVGGGPTSTGPSGADMIQGLIDKDIAAQKFNIEQQVAMKNNALKRVEAEVSRFTALAKNDNDKKQLQALQAQIGAARQSSIQEAARQKQMAMALTSGQGMSAEEVAVMMPANDPRRELLVVAPNGRFYQAGNAPQQKKYTEMTNDTRDAKALAETYKQQINEYQKEQTLGRVLPGKVLGFTLNQKKNEMETTAVALIGKLRLPFTGPGILSPEEYDRLANSIGKLNGVQPGAAAAQVESLTRLLDKLNVSQLASAGVQIRKSPKEQAREKLFKKYVNDGWSPAEIESAMKKQGMLND